MGRKPTKKDIILGCKAFFKDMIVALFHGNIDRAKFCWIMIRVTAKGDFEVIDDVN